MSLDMSLDDHYLGQCLLLAKGGEGLVAPNPMVGSMVVSPYGRVLGKGYHAYYGGPHAEVMALKDLRREDCASATLYISLEPCCHLKKNTPPCVPFILEKGIQRVCYASLDPNPLVAGEGIRQLREHGVEVVSGSPFLAKEERLLNKAFYTFMLKKRPYVILKWAQSYYGERGEGGVKLSNKLMQSMVHQLRQKTQAIMIGGKTLLDDGPRLDTRIERHGAGFVRSHPQKIILGRGCLQLSQEKIRSLQSSGLSHRCPSILFITENHERRGAKEKLIGVEYETRPSQDFPLKAQEILNILYEKKIQSVLIEGGRTLLQTFLEDVEGHFWDEKIVIVTPPLSSVLSHREELTNIIFHDYH